MTTFFTNQRLAGLGVLSSVCAIGVWAWNENQANTIAPLAQPSIPALIIPEDSVSTEVMKDNNAPLAQKQSGHHIKLPCKGSSEAFEFYMKKMAQADNERSWRNFFSRIDSFLGTDLNQDYQNSPYSSLIEGDEGYDLKSLCPPSHDSE